MGSNSAVESEEKSDEKSSEESTEKAGDNSGDSDGYQPAFRIQNERRGNSTAGNAQSFDDPSGDETPSESQEENSQGLDPSETIEGKEIIDAEGETIESHKVPEIDADTISPVLDATFDLAASRRGEHWTLSEKEVETLAEAYAPVLNKYMPHMASKHGPEAMAAFTTMIVLSPRVGKDIENGRFNIGGLGKDKEAPHIAEEIDREAAQEANLIGERENGHAPEPEPREEPPEDGSRVSAFNNL